MDFVAATVLVVVLLISLWSLRTAPGAQAAEQFVQIWKMRWGKQFYFDFFGLQAILALWTVSDAIARDSWVAAAICLATMPILGAMSAAAYWLLR